MYGGTSADSFARPPLIPHGSSLSKDSSSGEESDVEDSDKWSASETRAEDLDVRQNHRGSTLNEDRIQVCTAGIQVLARIGSCTHITVPQRPWSRLWCF